MQMSFPERRKRQRKFVFPVMFVAVLFVLVFALFGGKILQLCECKYQIICKKSEKKVVSVPVLLYHHIGDDVGKSTVISKERFTHQMQLLYDNGFQPISLNQLIAYVEDGTDLPEKAVVLTFDDGYYSNYDIAFPILKDYNYPATFFIIGSSFGHMRYYKKTGYTVTPHFGFYEAREMLDSELITIQSHSYDMHQWEPFESGSTIRENMLQLPGEGTNDYEKAIVNDYLLEYRVLQSLGIEDIYALAYPCGKYDRLLESIMCECGIKLSFTMDAAKINVLVKGVNSSLQKMGRMNICEMTTDEQLLDYLNQSVEFASF